MSQWPAAVPSCLLARFCGLLDAEGFDLHSLLCTCTTLWHSPGVWASRMAPACVQPAQCSPRHCYPAEVNELITDCELPSLALWPRHARPKHTASARLNRHCVLQRLLADTLADRKSMLLQDVSELQCQQCKLHELDVSWRSVGCKPRLACNSSKLAGLTCANCVPQL
jgi:hypothetical protein